MILEKIYLEKLKANEIMDLAKFVVSENLKHHSNGILSDEYMKDVRSIYREEMDYRENSEIFVAKNRLGVIMGSIRILRWNYKTVLPLQKIFGIHPLEATGRRPTYNIWHIGRFAIAKEFNNITLFKKLMVCTISPICRTTGNIAFAECDGKLLRILSLLGIKVEILGRSINYLGSETVPIRMTADGLFSFYRKNMDLVPSYLLRSTIEPDSVGMEEKSKNHPFV